MLAICEPLAVDVAVFSQARAREDLTEMRLDRAELGATVGFGEVRVEAVRSAGEGGALGVDGDSLVPRVKYAQAMGSVLAGPLKLDGALGLVPDVWLRTLETGYPLLPLSRTGSERLLGWQVADLAAAGKATWGPASLAVSVGNGEGLRYPERNTGKTTTAVLAVTLAPWLVLAAVGRDGSIGPASVRDHRAGGGATLTTEYVRAGAEAVHAWGLGDQGDLTGTLLAGWAMVTPLERLGLAARGATLKLTGGRQSTFGGAVMAVAWPRALSVWLAVERETTSGSASPVPGAATGDATTVMLIAAATGRYTP